MLDMTDSTLVIESLVNGNIEDSIKSIQLLQEDKKHFGHLKMPYSVIMGRKVMDTFPVPIRNCQNIVVSNKEITKTGFIQVKTLKDAISISETPPYIIGGSALYQQMIGVSKHVLLSYVDKQINNNTKVDLDKLFNLYRLVEKYNLETKNVRDSVEIFRLILK